jgi:hypothetical protein
MRVTLEHTTAKTGLIFGSGPAIQLTVQFTDTEKAVIKKASLATYVFYTAPFHPGVKDFMQGPKYVGTLLAGPITFRYQDLATARVEEEKIRDCLRTLKAAIDANVAPLKKSDTFEL